MTASLTCMEAWIYGDHYTDDFFMHFLHLKDWNFNAISISPLIHAMACRQEGDRPLLQMMVAKIIDVIWRLDKFLCRQFIGCTVLIFMHVEETVTNVFETHSGAVKTQNTANWGRSMKFGTDILLAILNDLRSGHTWFVPLIDLICINPRWPPPYKREP